MQLPDCFLKEMKYLLNEEFDSYLESFKQERLYGLRVNTMKARPSDFPDIIPKGAARIPWIQNGYYYKEEARPAKDPYYYAGLYYLQEPSAMTPASLLPISPNDKVLDICAAPGGKSTELGAKLNGTGLLFANDISNSRAKALLKNLELFGVPNICVTSETPERLAGQLPEYFDKILVDAPCSGEGMFRKDDGMIKSWLSNGPDYYAPIQSEILESSVKLLKPGGMLLYSTCTFSVKEDEEVIKTLLSKHDDMELVPIPLWDGASDGIGLSGCVRLFPHKIQGEGHFICLLRKRGGGMERPAVKANSPWRPTAEFTEFFSDFNYPIDNDRLFLNNNQIYYLPLAFPTKTKLRFLRTGLWLGSLNKNRFEPSQALAMVLNPEYCKRRVSFSRQDERTIRYLKGETIALSGTETTIKGWCLVCVDGYPLGFAKGMGQTLKNKYYPGWRWQ